MSPNGLLGIIPARAGSKGIPRKNIRLLAGKPLICYTIECAQAAGVFDRIILTTDCPQIAEVARAAGIEVPFLRPKELAGDDTPMVPVIQHALRELMKSGPVPERVMLLQPTAPLRQPGHILRALQLFEQSPCDSVVSVSPIPGHYHPNWSFQIKDGLLSEYFPGGLHITRRQDLPDVYSRDGTIYLFRRDLVLDRGTIYGEHCRALIIETENSLNLDSIKDWEAAQLRLDHPEYSSDLKRSEPTTPD